MNENSFEHDDDEDCPLTRVGEPHVTNCTAIEEDWVGVIRIKHKESGEERLLLEICQGIEDDDDLAETVADLIMEREMSAKVMLTPAAARQFAVALLNYADTADGTEPLGFDWDIKEIS